MEQSKARQATEHSPSEARLQRRVGGIMFARIMTGLGQPGKLWTGSAEFWQSSEGEWVERPENPDGSVWVPSRFSVEGHIAQVELGEWWSHNGASTRRLHITDMPSKAEADELEECCYIPELYVSAGGVGSIPWMGPKDEDPRWGIAVWNWSGRVGGFAIISPIKVMSGYVCPDDLPAAKPGFAWLKTYDGTTLSEYVLVRLDEDGAVHPMHRLALHRRPNAVLSPPERRVQEAWAAARTEEHSQPEENLPTDEDGRVVLPEGSLEMVYEA